MQTFRQEVTSEKMPITSSERDTCLSILRDMAHSSDETMYNCNMERLEAVGCVPVLDFVRLSWHGIRSQWVEGLKEQHLTLGETTMQRIESVSVKMKDVCCEIASLQQFFVEFRSFLASMRSERTHRAMTMLTRKPTTAIAEDLLPYRDCLTPYAFGMVQQHYNDSLSLGTSSEVDENVDTFVFTSATGSDTTRLGYCSCRVYSSRRLPCKHLLYVRRLREVEFDESVFDSRWKRVDYVSHCQLNLPNGGGTDLKFLDVKEEEDDSSGCSAKEKSERRRIEQAEKYRKARHMTDQIAALCVKSEMAVFSSRIKLLGQLYESWSRGTDVALVKLEPTTDVSSSPRKRGRPPKTGRQLQMKHPKPKQLKLVGHQNGSVKNGRKYRYSSFANDDDSPSAELCDGDVEPDGNAELETSDDVEAMLLAMAADNGASISVSDNDGETADTNFDESASGTAEGFIVDGDGITIGDDTQYVIVPENSELLTEVAQNRLELRPLDTMVDIQLSMMPPKRKRGRPPKRRVNTAPDNGTVVQLVATGGGIKDMHAASFVLQSGAGDA